MTRLRKLVTALVLLALMVGFGVGVNRYLASRQTHAFQTPKSPTAVKPAFTLPGTIYVAQQGGLFAFKGSSVVELQPVNQGWAQPVLLPDRTGLLAVKVTPRLYSDLYLLGLDGQVKQQLSHDAARDSKSDISGNHWIFYPRVGPDGALYFSYDEPKNGYQVDLSLWKSPVAGVGSQQMQRLSDANAYTGGDVSPTPLLGGDVVYVKYDISNDGKAFSQIRIRPTLRDDGQPLTQPADNCALPALSPDQTSMAMVCSPSSAESDLVVARFDPAKGLGPLRRVVVKQLASAPVWAPDGTSLLYLAPAGPSGYFQIWYLDKVLTPAPSAPRAITTELDLDATSAPAWSAT